MRKTIVAGAILGMLMILSWNPVYAVIAAASPLKKFEGDAAYIFVGKVDKHFPDKPAMLIKITEDIKGKAPFRQLPINCKIDDAKTFKDNQIEPLLKRFGPGIDIIFFVTPHGKKSYITFAFTNGTWFQVQGTKVDQEQVVFALKSAEPYFRKSFKGSNDELRKLLKDHVAKKGTLPDLDDKVPAGFGPEFEPKKGTAAPAPTRPTAWPTLSNGTGGQLFGVVVAPFVLGPMAILAMLFPTVFGGAFVLFRQWRAFITLISINGVVLLAFELLQQFPALLRGSWWTSAAAAWFVMTVINFSCAFWAWRRQLHLLADGAREAPQRTELAVLLFTAGSSVITLIVVWAFTEKISFSTNVAFVWIIVMALGVAAGTGYRFWSAYRRPDPFAAMPITTEGAILATMLLGHLVFVPAILGGGNVNTAGTARGKEQSGEMSAKVDPVVLKWDYKLPPEIKGMFASSPLIHEDAIYTSYSRTTGHAGVICLDRHGGLQKWESFGKGDDIKQMISTPCYHDGKLYFGEGFHRDKNCNVYCLDAKDGEEIWRFKTGGQTESSPTVANGKLYIGAGNDGIYCFNIKESLAAKKADVAWKHPDVGFKTRIAYQDKPRIQRFCGAMVVVGNRLYCGSGVDRDAEGDKGETATFCFDADSGKLLWKTPAPYAVWSMPIVKDGLLYIASGTGDVLEDGPETPGGALQCLDAETGKEKWVQQFKNGIIEAPAVDAHRIYLGCRDGHVYCLNRADGKQRWSYFLQSPVIGTPVLDCDPVYERSLSVFVVTTAGKVCCMTPQKGDIVWEFDLTDKHAVVTTSPRLVVERTAEGYTRRLYFGCGLGGGATDLFSNCPVFYCLEDKVKVE